MISSYEMKSTYGTGSPYPSSKTPMFTPQHDSPMTSPAINMTSPRYMSSFHQGYGMNPMQSPKYMPTSVNPTSRLNDTPSYMPPGLNPFESRRTSTPLTVFAGNRSSDEPTYGSSPTYSPIVHS
jgi:hypothetical protein